MYQALVPEAKGYDANPTSLIHCDAKPDNIIPGEFRPLIDPGLAKPSTPEFDLSRAFVSHPDFYVTAYSFFRNDLEQQEGRNFEITGDEVMGLQQRTRKLAFLNAVRLMAGMISVGRHAEARGYMDFAQQYLTLLTQPIQRSYRRPVLNRG